MAPTVWLLGERTVSGLNELGGALVEARCRVEFVSGKRVRAWRAQPDETERVIVPPNLLVVDVQTAFEDDAQLLEMRAEREPWCFLPLVVVSPKENVALCDRAYDMGAASWIVLPRGAQRRGEAASVFARYWTRANLLPDIHYFRIA